MYDIAIIGGGIGGLMAAYKIKKNNKAANIIIIEKGVALENRHCPAGSNKSCAHCKICSITSGYAGAGAFSDGKFNLGTAYGGTIGEELGEETAMKYIGEVDDILREFSDDYPELYLSNEELKLKCLQNNLRLLDMNVRHLGTDKNFKTMHRLIENLRCSGVELTVLTECAGIEKKSDSYVLSLKDQKGERSIEAGRVIIATGRGGADFVKGLCEKFSVKINANSVDIGVRVEMKDAIWREFSSKIYEPKILYRTKTFEDRTRMFCFNQGGLVSAENNDGVITANGHSFAEPEKKTDNCNFAILSSIHFAGDFNKPTEYAINIAKNMNFAGEGNIIVQRFGDLIRGRRTNDHRLTSNSVIPTLKAFAGDLSVVMPYRALTNIIETIYALDKVAPGCANDDTLLYGCENKYYSICPEHNGYFEIMDGMYLIGDGSGITRGLSQSGAMGLFVADHISGKIKE
ncbi:MAG: FAD-dependent oxidoreductase [Clostridiales bacterium]|nr:FAD-dependent oxidoreductase [Candidatus Equinaster intestinalis]